MFEHTLHSVLIHIAQMITHSPFLLGGDPPPCGVGTLCG
jgi:hypothetical protein